MRRFRLLSEEELHVVPGAAKEGPEQFLAVVFAPLLSIQKGKEKVIVAQRPKKDPETSSGGRCCLFFVQMTEIAALFSISRLLVYTRSDKEAGISIFVTSTRGRYLKMDDVGKEIKQLHTNR
jgi:hypothetical protein